MKKTTPKMTLEKLASSMAKGFERQDKNLEHLAEMVARGFSHMEEKMATKDEMNQRFEKVDESLQKIRHDIIGQGDRFVSNHQFERHVARFNTLETKVKTKTK